MKRIQAKHKKLLLELEFLYSDLEYHEDVFEEARREFHQSFSDYCDTHNINHETDIIKEEERKVEVSDPDKVTFRDEDGNVSDEEMEKEIREIEKTERPDEVRKLFKQIATKTHPDKFSNANNSEKSINKQVFLQAKAAAEENNYFKLQQIAQRLGVDLPKIDANRLKLMEKEAKRLKVKIQRIQKMVAWVWFDQDCDGKRNDVMQRYVTGLLRKSN